MTTVSIQDSIYQLVTQYPQIKEALEALGFTDISKPGMLQTAGRFMNLEKGSKMKGIPLTKIKAKFNELGFDIKEV